MSIVKKRKRVMKRKVGAEKNVTKESSKLKTKTDSVRLKLRKRGRRSKRRSATRKESKDLEEKNTSINPAQVVEAVQALLLVIEKTRNKDSQLFGDDPEPVLMQVAAARIPCVPSWRIRFKLPHPVITDYSDVCIFVRSLLKRPKIHQEVVKNIKSKKNRDKYYKKYNPYKIQLNSRNVEDRTVSHYKRRFEEKGISKISEIISLGQLKTEYGQYEEQRRLYQKFDVFLSDVRIGDKVVEHFGKFFKYSLKTPIPVRVHVNSFKEEIENALSKTTMHVHGKGDSFIVQVGHSKQTLEEIVQNILFVATVLAEKFPGGWDNVSNVYIKTSKSLSVPVYISMKSPNDIPVPTLKPLRPKKAIPVEAELSTVIGFTAKVFPAGKVVLKKTKEDSDLGWSDDEHDWKEQTKLENQEPLKKENSKSLKEKGEKPTRKLDKKTGKKESKVGVKDEKELEKEIADAEDLYLQQWKRERDEHNEKKENMKEEESVQPRRKKVKYDVGEMCFGRLDNNVPKNAKKSNLGGMAHTAFQALKSKMNRKKQGKKQNPAKNQIKSVVCSNKSSKSQKKSSMKGKNKH